MPEQPLDYFLADKPGAELTHSLIAEASQTLRRNCNEYLATLGNEQIISKLAEVGNLWRSPDYPLRQMALDADPEETGFPREVLAAGLDACFADWTQEKFFMLLTQEFGDPTRLQSFASQPNRTFSMVNGPQLIAHIAQGNLPVPVFQSIAFGLLLRSAQFVKCASGKSLLPRLFGHSLHFVEPGMAAALEACGETYLDPRVFEPLDALARECRKIGGTWLSDSLAEPTPFIRAIAMPRMSATAQVMRFDMARIAVSQGSACSSGTMKTSRVLEAMQVQPEIAANTIRVSTGWNSSREEVERFCEVWLDLAGA